MRPNLLMTIILPQLILSQPIKYKKEAAIAGSDITISPQQRIPPTIGNIVTAVGFKRTPANDTSFATWLRSIRLKNDPRVYLYNGQLKSNQSAQFAVLDIPIGKKNLQQCADAVMRLRAQFLYDNARYKDICFVDNNGKNYQYSSSHKQSFDQYLEKVYTYCGTISLEKQLKRANFQDIQIGNILIKGGSPGHAVIVVDMAINRQGKKIYLLAQSYMPAQDIHILKNPSNQELSPWYEVNDNPLIYTPEWVFKTDELKKW